MSSHVIKIASLLAINRDIQENRQLIAILSKIPTINRDKIADFDDMGLPKKTCEISYDHSMKHILLEATEAATSRWSAPSWMPLTASRFHISK